MCWLRARCRPKNGGTAVGADLRVAFDAGQTLERKVPHNLEAERSVLCAILLDNDAFHVAVRFIESKHFFLKEHGKIFARMARMFGERQAVDLVTLNEELERAGELEAAGGSAYLSALVDGVPRISHVEHYARIVQDKAVLRNLARFGDRLVHWSFDPRQDPRDLLNRADRELQILSCHYRGGQGPETNWPFRTDAEAAAKAPKEISWIARPWVTAGSMVELSGKPKVSGKTTWLLSLVSAVLDGRPFLGQPTERSPVIFLTEEQPETFRAALERAGLLGHPELVMLHHNEILGRPWESVAHAALDECQRRGARLLVVDTLGVFVGLEGDAENNSGDALLAMRPLREIAGAGIGVIVSRHERKSGGALGDSGRGSSAYAGLMDTLLALRRPERNSRANLRVIHGISRFAGVPAELVVELTPEGYLARGSRADVAAQEATKAILAAAPVSQEDALDLDSLLQGTPVIRATARRVVKGLLGAGKLARTGSGKKGDAFRYFIVEKLSGLCPSLDGQDGQKETETVRAGLEAGRRAGFWGDRVKKPEKPDGSEEAEL